jgi:hypothetical protein
MSPIDAMLELLGRVDACRGAPVLVNDEELLQWPGTAVKAMKSQKLLTKARPASSAICQGCERECVMPVHNLASAAGAPASFVVCDKRFDINRVAIPAERLTQWQCNAELICEFVTTSIGLRRRARQTGGAGRWEIGIAFGEKRGQMLRLEVSDTLALVAGNNMVPFAEVIQFQDGEYALDKAMVRRLVDAVTTTDNRYTPSKARREARKLETQAMYESWRKAYRDLRKKRLNMSDVWYSLRISKMDIAQGRESETIRKKMKK